MDIGQNILAWRRFKKMTQTELSSKTAIPQPNIAMLEAGRLDPKLSTLRRLAHALELTPGHLIDKLPPQIGWNRHRIDALVRTSKKRKDKNAQLTEKWRRALRVVAAAKFEAAGQHVLLNGRTGERLIKQLRADLGPSIWPAVLRRLDKYLANSRILRKR